MRSKAASLTPSPRSRPRAPRFGRGFHMMRSGIRTVVPCGTRRKGKIIFLCEDCQKSERTSPGTDPQNTSPRSDGPKERATPAARVKRARAVAGPPAPTPVSPTATTRPVEFVPLYAWVRAADHYQAPGGWVARKRYRAAWTAENLTMGLYFGPVETLRDAKDGVARLTIYLSRWRIAVRD